MMFRDSNPADVLEVLRISLQAHERCLPQIRGVLPQQDTEYAITRLRRLIQSLENSGSK